MLGGGKEELEKSLAEMKELLEEAKEREKGLEVRKLSFQFRCAMKLVHQHETIMMYRWLCFTHRSTTTSAPRFRYVHESAIRNKERNTHYEVYVDN